MLILLQFGITSCDKLKLPMSPSEKCAVPSVYESMKTIIFDNVDGANNENPLKINDWKKSLIISVEMPRLSGYDKVLKKTSCSGRIVFAIPQEERKYFNGDSELKGDVTYTIQPAADKNGDIISLDGFEFLVNDIVAANGRAVGMKDAKIESARQAAEQAKAQQLEAVQYPSSNSNITHTMYVITKEANLRAKPDPNSPSLGKLSFGTYLTVDSQANYFDATKNINRAWYHVTYDDAEGWVNSRLVATNLPDSPVTSFDSE